MATDDTVVFLLIMAAGILALTVAIFAGSMLVTYLRRAEPVDDAPSNGGKKFYVSAGSIQ